jgi:hypothetical protein
MRRPLYCLLQLGGKCGGFAGLPCDQGLACKTPPDTADAFGTCQVHAQGLGPHHAALLRVTGS